MFWSQCFPGKTLPSKAFNRACTVQRSAHEGEVWPLFSVALTAPSNNSLYHIPSNRSMGSSRSRGTAAGADAAPVGGAAIPGGAFGSVAALLDNPGHGPPRSRGSTEMLRQQLAGMHGHRVPGDMHGDAADVDSQHAYAVNIGATVDSQVRTKLAVPLSP